MDELKMNVVLYARVSSEKQAEKDLSLPAQLKSLRDYALRKEWTIVHEYVDAAESARSADRPQFQEMIATAKQKDRTFEAILVWKLNRFARNREDSIIFKSLLRKKGIQVISMNEKFEDNATGKLMEAIVEAMDEFYSANLAQDTVRGMRENASRGFWNGGREPYGYNVEKIQVGKNLKNKLKVVPQEAELIKRVFAMCLKGNGIKEVSKELNREGLRRRNGKPWNISTISYILKNETYTGTVVWRDHKNKSQIIKTPNAHEAIIDKNIYDRAQLLQKQRTRFVIPPRAASSDHLLSTMLKCKKCDHSMAACGAKAGKYHYYTCQSYVKMGPGHCNQKLLNAEKLEAFIVKTLKERVLTEENVKKFLLFVNEEVNLFVKDYAAKIASLQANIEEKRERRRKLYNTIETGTLNYSDVAPRIKELNDEVDLLTAEIQEIKAQKTHQEPIELTDEEIRPYVLDLKETLMTGSIVERKSFMRTFIKEIRIDYPRAEVEYTIPLRIPNKETPSKEEVLCMYQIGSPNGI